MAKKRKKIYDGVDNKAFNKAGKIGGTSEEMSKNYYNEKKKNNIEKIISWFLKIPVFIIKEFIKKVKQQKPNQKKKQRKKQSKSTVFDLIRKYKSIKPISDISNRFSEILTNHFFKKLSKKEKNIVRSAMSLVISETLNDALREEINFIRNIEMFIMVGKVIYKLSLKLNKNTRTFEVDKNNVFIVEEDNEQYKKFLQKYPQLKIKYNNQKKFSKCPLCGAKIKIIEKDNKVFCQCCNYDSKKCNYKEQLR